MKITTHIHPRAQEPGLYEYRQHYFVARNELVLCCWLDELLQSSIATYKGMTIVPDQATRASALLAWALEKQAELSLRCKHPSPRKNINLSRIAPSEDDLRQFFPQQSPHQS